jgi:hypothetical protein
VNCDLSRFWYFFPIFVTKAKRILRYFRGTVQFGIHYSSGGTPLLVGFTDSDWAGDPDDRKSIVGYVFSLGS